MLLHQPLIDGARRTPDRVAFRWVNRDRVLTYGEAVEAMDRVAGALTALGVQRGDRVAVFAYNGMDYLLAMLGAWRIGAISALVNIAYAEQLDYYIADCEPTVLIYTGDHHPTIDRHRAALAGVRHLVCLDGPQDGSLPWSAVLEEASPVSRVAVDDRDVAHISYTSGTSGDPKGVGLAHEPTARATRCIAERLRITSEDVSYGPRALSSSYQLVANLLPPLHLGAEVCVTSKWTPQAGWDDLHQLGATILAANPTVLNDLLVESRRRGSAPPSLRLGVSGGGPVPPGLKQAWTEELGITLAESYGQSELGGFFGLGGPEPLPANALSACGRPLPDKEVRILDDSGQEVAPGTLGEIALRGGWMAGYWGRPEQTARATRGSWLHSGDVGFMDREGYLYLRGRLSERITIDGRHWYPRDVEEALLRNPFVEQAAVIGLPSGEAGDRPIAYVLVSDSAAPIGELGRWVEAQLGAAPPGLEVEAVTEMPMTPTGKINKARLIAMAGAR